MDDEDLQDLKDSREIVDETEQMDFLSGSRRQGLGEGNDDLDKECVNYCWLSYPETDFLDNSPITQALESTLLPPPKDSVGAKILKKMGWRLGQGIGPRISLKRRREQDAQAYDPLTGNRIISGSLGIQEDDEEASKHTYANRDTPILSVKRKDNTHGLGYVSGLTLQESLGDNNARGSSGPRLAGI